MKGFTEKKIRLLAKLEELLGCKGELVTGSRQERDSLLATKYVDSFLLVLEGEDGSWIVAESFPEMERYETTMTRLFDELTQEELMMTSVYECGVVGRNDSNFLHLV